MKKVLLVATLSIVFLGFDARAFAERCGCVYCFESVISGWEPQNDCCKQAENFVALIGTAVILLAFTRQLCEIEN